MILTVLKLPCQTPQKSDPIKIVNSDEGYFYLLSANRARNLDYWSRRGLSIHKYKLKESNLTLLNQVITSKKISDSIAINYGMQIQIFKKRCAFLTYNNNNLVSLLREEKKNSAYYKKERNKYRKKYVIKVATDVSLFILTMLLIIKSYIK